MLPSKLQAGLDALWNEDDHCGVTNAVALEEWFDGLSALGTTIYMDYKAADAIAEALGWEQIDGADDGGSEMHVYDAGGHVFVVETNSNTTQVIERADWDGWYETCPEYEARKVDDDA